MDNQIINIVCSYNYNKYLSRLNEYKIDLGRTYTKKDEFNHNLEPNIRDSFVIDFYKKYNSLIYKVGVLGSISIYTYSNLLPNQAIIHKNGEFFHRVIDLQEAEFNIEKTLAELIWSLDKTE